MTRKSRILARIAVSTLFVALLTPLFANAATITSGTLTLGDPRPGQTTSYTFTGSSFSGTAIKCIQLKFAVNADGTGGVPTGLTTTGATLTSSTLITAGSWTVGNAAGIVKITNASGAAPNASGNVVWSGILNGNTSNTTYYGLFNTYTNTDCATGPVDSTVVAFIYKDGALVSLTVDPTLTFTIAGVGTSAQTVNGATVNISSTPTAIDFARTVTASVKGVAAHDLTVATNAANGFTVNLRQTGGLTNGTYTIPALGAPNTAPISFTAAGTEGWGYTTEDATLGGGTAARFSGNKWAGMPTTNELVMDSTTSGSQTTRVGQQLGIAATTPAGNYSTTLVYTAAGTY